MAKRQPITVVGFLEMPDGSVKPIEELTPEERARWDKESNERLKRVMTEHYRIPPEGLQFLEDAPPDIEDDI